MKLVLLMFVFVLCSCGVRVHQKGSIWSCTKEGLFARDSFQFKTVEEANEMCHNLLHNISPMKKKMTDQIGK